MRLPTLLLSCAVAAVLVLGTLSLPAAAGAATAPRTPSGLPSAIEPLADYVGQVSCDQRTKPGTLKLARLLTSTYNTTAATTYACGTDGAQSEHYDGRAIDWMVDVHSARQYAAAKTVLSWLLRADRAGNRYATARRLGVMYVIYNNRMWGAWNGQWQEYNGCSRLRSRGNDNACHRTHMHISLGWNGAMGRTTFWTKPLTATDYGPCRRSGMNWAYLYTRPNAHGCPSASRPHAAKGASATKRALVKYSGASVRSGWDGPAVTAVQRALHVKQTGHYNASTRRAVLAFQRTHRGAVATGAMNISTWAALLAAVR